MPWSPPITFGPGVDVVKTPMLNAQGWSSSNLIRFRDGLVEKNGGWAQISAQTITGTARGSLAWADLSGNPYYAWGTEQLLQVLNQGGITDITPVRLTTNPAVNFSTVINTKAVTVFDAGMPATLAVGDWVEIEIPVSVGGIVIVGDVQVTATTLPATTTFTFNWTAAATATVNNAGAVPVYDSTNLSSSIKVTLANHGYAVGDIYVNQVLTTIATVAIGAYSQWPTSVVDNANVFHFIAGSAANANTTLSENAGNARINYLIATGYATSQLLAGFGVDLFGAGYYGQNLNGVTYSTIRQWFLSQWGEDLLASYPQSPIYVFVPPVALGNRAIAINTTNFPGAHSPPAKTNFSFISMPSQIAVALGCDPSGGGTQDPNLVRWCNVADFTDWVATATNQAGSYRVPTGSRLMGGLRAPMFSVIWTDIDMYTFNYLGFPLVFGFNLVSGSVGLLSARAMQMVQSTVFFCGYNGVYKFDGANVTVVPCPVWDIMWRNLNLIQVDKVHMGVNSLFQELIIFFPSLSGNGEVDSFIRYNWREGLWDYGASGTLLARTTWVDRCVLGPPLGIDLNGIIQQHDLPQVYDANGQQMMEYIESGYFSIDNGYLFTDIQKFIAELKFEGTAQVQYWLYSIDYPTDTPVQYGPFVQTSTGPQFTLPNLRGRMIKIRIGFSNVGSWWRLGNARHLYSPNGQI